jgi:hypothetical protein
MPEADWNIEKSKNNNPWVILFIGGAFIVLVGGGTLILRKQINNSRPKKKVVRKPLPPRPVPPVKPKPKTEINPKPIKKPIPKNNVPLPKKTGAVPGQVKTVSGGARQVTQAVVPTSAKEISSEKDKLPSDANKPSKPVSPQWVQTDIPKDNLPPENLSIKQTEQKKQLPTPISKVQKTSHQKTEQSEKEDDLQKHIDLLKRLNQGE